MKFLFDFFPILLFFIAYKVYDIFVATAVAIVASCVQVGWFWIKHRRVENMHLITLILIIVLGGATLFFQDETFIKWKPTVVNWAFAIAFLGSQFIGKKTFVQRMMESNITLKTDTVWPILNMAWVIFFVVMGAINLFVAFNFSTDTWVNFKLFGMMGLTLIFVFGQGFYLVKYIDMDKKEETSTDIPN